MQLHQYMRCNTTTQQKHAATSTDDNRCFQGTIKSDGHTGHACLRQFVTPKHT